MCEWNVWIGANEDSSVMVTPLRKLQGVLASVRTGNSWTDMYSFCILFHIKHWIEVFFFFIDWLMYLFIFLSYWGSACRGDLLTLSTYNPVSHISDTRKEALVLVKCKRCVMTLFVKHLLLPVVVVAIIVETHIKLWIVHFEMYS